MGASEAANSGNVIQMPPSGVTNNSFDVASAGDIAAPASFTAKQPLTVLITTYDSNGIGGTFGSHSALYMNDGSTSYIYDPGGSYSVTPTPGEPSYRPSGGVFEGPAEASLNAYIQYQIGTGSIVVSTVINLSPQQQGNVLTAANNYGDPGPGFCAAAVSSVLNGYSGVSNTYLPGSLANMIQTYNTPRVPIYYPSSSMNAN